MTAFSQRIYDLKRKTNSNTDSFTSEPTSHGAEPGVQDFKGSLSRSSLFIRNLAARASCLHRSGHCGPSDGQSPRLPGGWGVGQPTAGGGMLWVPLSPWGPQAGAAACCSSLPSTDSPRHSTETTKLHERHSDHDITSDTTCVFSHGVCGELAHV